MRYTDNCRSQFLTKCVGNVMYTASPGKIESPFLESISTTSLWGSAQSHILDTTCTLATWDIINISQINWLIFWLLEVCSSMIICSFNDKGSTFLILTHCKLPIMSSWMMMQTSKAPAPTPPPGFFHLPMVHAMSSFTGAIYTSIQ